MFVVTIIPIDRAILLESLPYMSVQSLDIGTMVQAPFQKKSLIGIVIDCVDALHIRAQVKNAGFQLRGGVCTIDTSLPADYITKLVAYCTLNNARTSTVFHAFFAPLLGVLSEISWSSTVKPVQILQNNIQNRKACYAELSKDRQLIIVPNALYAAAYARELDCVSITTKPQLKKILTLCQNTIDNTSTVITTLEFLPDLLSVFRHIIFDTINNPLYNLWIGKQSYINRIPLWVNMLRYMPEYIITIADCVLPFPDVLNQSLQDETGSVISWELPKVSILDCEREKGIPLDLSQLHIWLKNFQKKGLLSGIIVCNQREWFGYTVCPACGYNKRCPVCDSFLRTQRNINGSLGFMCTKCSHTESVWDLCTGCAGYTLQSARAGLDQYQQIITDTLATTKSYILSSETKNPHTLWREWCSTGGILLATSSITNYPPTERVQSLLITSSLSSDASNSESLLALCISLCGYSEQSVIPKALWERLVYYDTDISTKPQKKHDNASITQWYNQALYEHEQAQKYQVQLSCVFW
jgi:hypothetical protein